VAPRPRRSVLARLAPLVDRLAALVEEQRHAWSAADGLGHGLFIGEADVDIALDGLRGLGLARSEDAPEIAVDRLQAVFGLEDVEIDVLVAAAAPDLDRRFGLLYAYLNDDPARRLLSVDLALRVLDRPAWDGVARHVLGPQATLARSHLVEIETVGDVLRRAIAVPERVTAHLLGIDAAPSEVARAQVPLLGGVPAPADVAAALRSGVAITYLRSPHEAGAPIAVAAAAEETDVRVVHLDLRSIPEGISLPQWLPVALREAALQGVVPLLGPVADGLPAGTFDALDLAQVPVLLHGPSDWDVALSTAVPVTIDVEPLTEAQQAQVWQGALDAAEVEVDGAALAALRVGGAEVARTIRRAATLARVLGRPVDAALVAEQIRREHAPVLERLARRVVASVGLDQLVLPALTRARVEAFLERARNRDRVREELGVRSRGVKGRGLTALFSGPSGTGKTLTAEAICGELGLDLYVVSLPSVLSKYIGETEQNLERVFAAAEDIPGILFFDEADALFGKRSEVSDSRDRYANIEVAYLLQRLEQFDGVTVLASNLRANLDAAFNRRLDAIIAFPEPGVDERQRLWDAHLPPALPRAADLDLAFAAAQFSLSGGSIASATQSAAHEVARSGRPLDDGMVARAIAAELEKAGRLLNEDEFGGWLAYLDA
jgi:hypothetical protein